MTRSFSGWREGAKFYLPFIVVGIAVIALGYTVTGTIILLIGLSMLGFFRDPPRSSSSDPRHIVSPADGTIVAIEDLSDTPHYDGPCIRISIFLSVFNVHVNRTPYAGTIRHIRYQPGGYKNAMKAETSLTNESNALWLDTSHGLCTVRQITGAIARRIVCVVNEGETLEKGEKFGMIRFGSRTELYLPPDTEVCVTMRQKVNGGSTVIARFP